MKQLGEPLKQRARRILCVVAASLVMVSFLLGFLGKAFAFQSFLPLILYGVAIFWLNRSTSGMANAKDRKLDERQRALRDRAYRLSYAGFVSFALFMSGVDFFGRGAVRVAYGVDEQSINSLLLTANFFLLSALPILCIAWLEPDPVEDDIEVKQGIAQTT